VGELDAFGRQKGEEPTGLGTGAPTTAPSSGQRARGIGPGVRLGASLLVTLLIAAAVATAVIFLPGTSAETKIGSAPVGTSKPSGTVLAIPPPQFAAKPPSGLAGRSLITPLNLARALGRLHGRGRLRLLSVRSDRIDAQLVTGGGKLRNVQVAFDGRLRDFGAHGSGAGGLPTIAFARVDPAAAQRIVRAAARRAGTKPARVDYLVLLELPNGQSWNVYFKSGIHFMADAHGANLRRL
jgi:hypothetical protein